MSTAVVFGKGAYAPLDNTISDTIAFKNLTETIKSSKLACN